MTIVVGYLPPDGALLGADCRVTFQGHGGPVCTDVAQKIIKLGPATAIGYSGDILGVTSLLANLWRELPRRRVDPLSMRLWLPRFFRYIYRRLRVLNYPQPKVSFLVASSLIGKPTRIPKTRAWEFLTDAPLHGFNDFLFLRIGPNINAPGTFYEVRDTSMGMLYKLESPDFEAIDYPPLSFAVIGSGSDASQDLEAYELPLATAHPNRTASWFIDALTGFLHRTNETTVGGWILGAELVNGGVLSLGYQYDPSGQNRQVGIRVCDGRFVLDAGDGREIVLLYPSEIIGRPPQKPVDVLKNFSSTETDRRAKLLHQLRPYHPSSRK